MNSVIYDDKICLKGHIYRYYKIFTEKLNHRDCVKFALFCAKYVNPNTKESNDCIELIEKWLIDAKSVSTQQLYAAANASFSAYASYAVYASNAAGAAANATANASYAANTVSYAASYAANTVSYATWVIADVWAVDTFYNSTNYNSTNTADVAINITNINKYLQILLRKTRQFQNNKILDQISQTDVDKLELVDWNMITDIMLEDYNIVHEFSYEDIFSRRCLIELLRREYL